MHGSRLSSSQASLGVAILLIVGGMACPNEPWDAGDAASEMSRLHAPEAGTAKAGDLGGVPTSLARLRVVITRADGQPASGITVRVADARGRRRCFEGATDAGGACEAEIAVPADAEEFVIEWFAPVRMTTRVERVELGDLRLSLPQW